MFILGSTSNIFKKFLFFTFLISFSTPVFPSESDYSWVITFTHYTLDSSRVGRAQSKAKFGYYCVGGKKNKGYAKETIQEYLETVQNPECKNTYWFRDKDGPDKISGWPVDRKNLIYCYAYLKVDGDKDAGVEVSLDECMDDFRDNSELQSCEVRIDNDGVAIFAEIRRLPKPTAQLKSNQ